MAAKRKLRKWVTVSRFAVCRYCGADDLAWLQLESGKWYLALARERPDGGVEALPFAFHDCPARPPQPTADDAWVERIVLTGYRTLAKECHPDRGGSTADMQQVNLAMEKLRELLRKSQT
jgi:hypothetical protein